MKNAAQSFWERKALGEMDAQEWESLCDGCARCCAIKLEDEATGEVVTTRVVCRLLDLENCRCTHYPERHRLVPDCVRLTPPRPWRDLTGCRRRAPIAGWPRAAAWRGGTPWYPAIPTLSWTAGISVRGSVVSERDIHPRDIVDHVAVRWVDAPSDPGP